MFSAIGGVATAVQYVVLILLVSRWSCPPALGSSVGFSISAILNYTLNHRFTFRSGSPHRLALPRFATMVLIGLGLTASLMAMLHLLSSMPYLLAQLITTGVVLLWNFAISRYWTFAERA
jgi:putative flippase GtrA